MLPHSDSHYVRNEMKALKYIQNEILELSQIQNQINDISGQNQYNNKNQQSQKSIFKNLILPLLASIECGGFFIFASPTIYILDYDETQNEDEEALFEEAKDLANYKQMAQSHFSRESDLLDIQEK